MSITNQGVANSAPALIIEEPEFPLPPLLLKFTTTVQPFINGGTGVVQLYSDGSRRGYIFDGLPGGIAAQAIW
jgi:hypothetical protein